MAEPWTPPEDGPAEQPFRAFSRQALEATLAEALRDVEASEEPTEAEEALPRAEADRPPLKPPSPFSRSASPPPPPPAPKPAAAIDNLVSGTLAGTPSRLPTGRPVGGVGDPSPTRLPSPGLLSGNGGGSSGLPSLRPPSLSDLSGSRGVSGYAQAPEEPPAEQATIALRRPRRAEADAVPEGVAAASEGHAQAATAPHAPAPKPMAPIAAWSPSDDDILPHGAVKRRSFRFKW